MRCFRLQLYGHDYRGFLIKEAVDVGAGSEIKPFRRFALTDFSTCNGAVVTPYLQFDNLVFFVADEGKNTD